MTKITVYTLSKEAGIDSNEFAALLIELGYDVKSDNSILSKELADEIRYEIGINQSHTAPHPLLEGKQKIRRDISFDKEGYDRDGYDRDGYSRHGYDRKGWGSNGINKITGTKFDLAGYDRDGYDRSGYDRKGYGRDDSKRNFITTPKKRLLTPEDKIMISKRYLPQKW